ncbi:MAG: glutaredoxin [Tissierellia bacterium]|nr:glutaredoxin [Tissierellia bacterium]
MKRFKLFISSLCKDTARAIEYLDSKKCDYEIRDITSSLSDLKEFLKYRDSRLEFEDIKRDDKIGVPMLLIDDSDLIFDISEDGLKGFKW